MEKLTNRVLVTSDPTSIATLHSLRRRRIKQVGHKISSLASRKRAYLVESNSTARFRASTTFSAIIKQPKNYTAIQIKGTRSLSEIMLMSLESRGTNFPCIRTQMNSFPFKKLRWKRHSIISNLFLHHNPTTEMGCNWFSAKIVFKEFELKA